MKTSISRPCADWAEQLAAVLPADLPPADQAALEAHLATCPACAAVKADYQRMDASIRALPAPRPLRGLPPRLLELWAEEDRRAGVHQPVMRPRVPEVFMQTTPHPGASSPAPTPLHPERPLRRRLISAMTAVAVVLIVLSIAIALLVSRAGPGSQTGRGGTAAPTPTPGAGGLTASTLLPTLAPGNPQIIYEAQLSSDNLPASVTLRRSDDAGASWHSLPVPTGITQVDWAGFFVSPFNAQQVFLEVNAACPTAQTSAAAPIAAYSSGANVCTFDYVSTDGGAHWNRVHWPVHGTDTSHTRLGAFYTYSPFKAQGNRLYALLSTGEGNASSFVVSEDGGLTWRFADQPLVNRGNCVYDYAPTPTGATVFAVVVSPCSPGNAHLNSYTSQQRPEAGGGGNALWRSDDAGAHWTQVGPFAGAATGARDLLARLNSAGQPVLYDDGFLPPDNTFPPSVTKVSLDGGKTWRPAPPGVTQYADSSILGTLSDGSIIEAFTDAKTHRDQLFAWKAGEAGWQRISPDFDGAPQYVLAAPAGSGGQTLWLVTNASGTFSVRHFALA